MTSPLAYEKVWINKHKYDEAEKNYFEKIAKLLLNNGIPVPVKTNPHSEPVPEKIPDIILSPEPVLLESITETKPVLVTFDDKQVKPNIKDNDKEKRFKVKERKRNKKQLQKKNEENKVSSNNPITKNTLAGEVAKARQHIMNSLECMDGIASLDNPGAEVNKRIAQLEKQTQSLQEELSALKDLVKSLSSDISNICKNQKNVQSAAPSANIPAKPAAPKPSNDADDDGIDLFGSDSEEEDAEAKRVREQRLADYQNRKAKKPVLIAKSMIILDVKPWDDETDMKQLEAEVRKVGMDGLIWGTSKLVPLAYGIHKLQISCVVEDDKVSVDLLQETLQDIEEFVQSVDIAAFNKV